MKDYEEPFAYFVEISTSDVIFVSVVVPTDPPPDDHDNIEIDGDDFFGSMFG